MRSFENLINLKTDILAFKAFFEHIWAEFELA